MNEVNTPEVVEETTTVGETQTTPEIKTFKQEEVDNIVKGRLERERQSILKNLGVETLDDAKLRISKAIETEGLQEKFKAELEAERQAKQTLEQDVLKYKLGIKEDKFKEALTLAKLKQEGSDLKVDDALEQVLKEYPSMRNGIKVGLEPTQGDAKPEPTYSKKFLEENRNIPYYAKLLQEGNYKK